MTKKREPDSAQGALNTAILELGPCPLLGDQQWERAARELKISVSKLYGATNPSPPPNRYVPILLDWVEKIDLLLEREGRGPFNRLAWTARHEAGVAGVVLPPTTPEVLLQRAVKEVKEALDGYERGQGDPVLILTHLGTLQDLCAALLKAWSERLARQTEEDKQLKIVKRQQ